jgi:hypothetical protein
LKYISEEGHCFKIITSSYKLKCVYCRFKFDSEWVKWQQGYTLHSCVEKLIVYEHAIFILETNNVAIFEVIYYLMLNTK